MAILVCGSLAFDTVMVLSDKLRMTQAAEKGQILNLYFLVPDLRRSYGGCAGNIAYNLKLLGKTAWPMGTVGTDFTPYAIWLDKQGINRQHIKVIEHNYTAQTYITHDVDDNRITAFHPGAMNLSHVNPVPVNPAITLGVIAPDSEEGMQIHAQQFCENGTPFLYYPGHSLHQILGEDILSYIEQASWMVLNTEEWALVTRKTGLTEEQLASRLRALIINRGQDGATFYSLGVCYKTPGVPLKNLQDASGCDDAFCAGLLYGLANDIDWETTGRIASLIWAITAEHHGTQHHHFSLDAFKSLFRQAFGYALFT